MVEVVLTTARLRLGRWLSSQVPDALRLWGDPTVMRFVGRPHEGLARSRAAVEAAIEAEGQHGCCLWRAEDRGGSFVGCCGFHVYDGPGSRRAGTVWRELAYHLLPHRWGQGLATEAARGCLAWAYDHGITHVVAFADPENTASWRLLERLGFCVEGASGDERRYLIRLEPGSGGALPWTR